jgi:hypothetical protein
MIFLETNRLLFRTHEPQDEADFIRMHTDPEVRRYVGGSAWPVEKAVARFRGSYLLGRSGEGRERSTTHAARGALFLPARLYYNSREGITRRRAR